MKRKFTVGVIGTQNTGKSTFIQDILAEFKGTADEFKTVGCDYRKKIEEAGLKINRNGNLEAQKIICDTLIEQLDIIAKMPDGNYITDRSPIDSYAYTVYLYRHNPELGITEADLSEMFNKVKNAIVDYDMIIFIDLDKCSNVEVVDDKFRDTNIEYRKEIDMIFKETLDALGCDTLKSQLVTDITGSREERIAMFKSLLTTI